MYYYHITKEQDVPMILERGLSPFIGEFAKISGEIRPAIYLCQKRDIPYWKIILNKYSIIRIKGIDPSEVEEYEYDCYREYVYYDTILPSQCALVDLPAPGNDVMRDVCFSYLHIISEITVALAQYYTANKYSYKAKDLKYLLQTSLFALEHLDYFCCTEDEIQKALIKAGESGEYTFADTYWNTGRRLYQQLLYYPQDDLMDLRKKLFDYVQKNLKCCQNLNTGGWMG